MFKLNERDKALLNPSRFYIYLYLLKNGPGTASELASKIEIYDSKNKKVKRLSKVAVSKHCKILEEAGLLIPEARFKGKQGIGKLYKATQKSRWRDFILTRGLNPDKIPEEVYTKMDELAFHPKYLKIVKTELDEGDEVSLIRQRERLDSILFERKDKIFTLIKNDPELNSIYEAGFKKFFKFLLKGK